jgi:hypothetical protein
MMEGKMWADIWLGTAGFMLYIATVAVALRLSWSWSPAGLAIGAAFTAYAVVLTAAAVISREANFWTTSIFFWFPTVVFLMGFGAVYKSVSLRILLDLLLRPGHAEGYSAMLARYVAAESFENRLVVMQESGLAVATSSGYALTGKGRLLAGVVGALQRLFAIERSG